MTLPRCVVDNVTSRQLPHQVCEVTGGCALLSVEWCAAECRKANFSLAGVEAGHQCCCGNALTDATAQAPTSDCSSPCTGNASETCGGSLRLWVFVPTTVGPPPPEAADPKLDPRWIPNGAPIHSGGYLCQPYCAVLPSGAWSCVMTRIHDGVWAEGSPGEHMVSMRTSDHGQTWSDFVAIEPYSNVSTGQVSAYGSVLARGDGSRVFALWIQNVHNVSHLPGQPPSSGFRADMLGEFVWKFSDDGGATWSPRHYRIPVPSGYIESVNSFSKAKGGDGTTQVMWQVDHVKTLQVRDGTTTALFAFTKIGTYAVAPPEEIFVLASPNLLTEPDPTLVTWTMWPDGPHGVPAVGAAFGGVPPADVVAEEPHVMPIHNDSSLYVVFRTSQGYLGSAQSQGDGGFGAPWQPSAFARYGATWADAVPNASFVKNCRGPISPKRQPRGMGGGDVWLMTYYNTAPLGAFSAQDLALSDRNNMWLAAGYEENGTVLWSQPELLLYDRERKRGHGYPDVITDGATGAVFVTEAYKYVPHAEAKTHAVAPELIAALLAQPTAAHAAKGWAAVLEGGGSASIAAASSALPNFAEYRHARFGLTLDYLLSPLPSKAPLTRLLDASVSVPSGSDGGADGVGGGGGAEEGGAWRGLRVSAYGNGTHALEMRDARGLNASWRTDPICSARLASAGTHHVGVVVDGGPKMILWVVDGKLCDGGPWGAAVGAGDAWPHGFGIFDPRLADIGTGVASMSAATALRKARYYTRALFTSELIGNWRAGSSK